MPAGLSSQDILDLANFTLADQPKLKFGMVATNLTDYPMFRRIMRKERAQVEGAETIRRNIMWRTSGNARIVKLYQPEAITSLDNFISVTSQWTHIEAPWQFEHREVLMQGGTANAVIKLAKTRPMEAMIDLAALVEGQMCGYPGSGETVNEKMLGLPYHVTYSASTGFNGGHCAGQSSWLNISRTTYPKLKNYTAQYTNVTDEDLLLKMRTAEEQCSFISPVDYADIRKGKGFRREILTDLTTKLAFEGLGRAQNQDIGWDLDAGAKKVTFHGHPITRIPYFDDAAFAGYSYGPVYMIDWNTWYVFTLKGNFLRRSEATNRHHHNVYEGFIDLSMQPWCIDPRSNALFATTSFGV